MRDKKTGVFLGMLVIWLIAGIASLMSGHYNESPEAIMKTIADLLTGNVPSNRQTVSIILNVRLPRILLASLVGAALSVSGAVYQGVFKNPLVSPDILGVSSGASLGAVLGIFFYMPDAVTQLMSFGGGIAAVLLVHGMAGIVSRREESLLILILSGTVVSSVFNAFITLLKYVADTDNQLPAITYWLMGSFARTSKWSTLTMLAVLVLMALLPVILLRQRLNVLSFGDEEAKSMGINVKGTRMVFILCSTLLTSISVSLCGVVGWVGLIVPHIIRLMTGPNYDSLIPQSVAGGAAFMVLADLCTRNMATELPISVLTALVGAPLFMFIVYRSREWRSGTA